MGYLETHARARSSRPRFNFRCAAASPRVLTGRERHLLALLIEGHHKKTAADVMGISVNTVSFHLKNIYEKLQVHSKTEAVVKVLAHALLFSHCGVSAANSAVAGTDAAGHTWTRDAIRRTASRAR